MAQRLTITDPDFSEQFAAFLASKREVSEDVDAAACAIIEAVKANGDRAVIELSQKFDHVDLNEHRIQVSDEEIERAFANADPETIAALEFAHQRITSYHKRQRPGDDSL
ncbi:MAG: histidinol dehydrogenase [Pseudomonadota bacterium]